MTTTSKKAEGAEMPTLNIWQKLHAAKQQIGKVSKNAKNPHFKNSYADINALLDTVEPILHEHGLLLLQPVVGNDVVTRIIDIESGEQIESFMSLPPIVDPQKVHVGVSFLKSSELFSLGRRVPCLRVHHYLYLHGHIHLQQLSDRGDHLALAEYSQCDVIALEV